MIDPFDRIGALRKKPVPRKCSTCADKRCAVRWRAVNWLSCRKWTSESDIQQDTTKMEAE